MKNMKIVSVLTSALGVLKKVYVGAITFLITIFAVLGITMCMYPEEYLEKLGTLSPADYQALGALPSLLLVLLILYLIFIFIRWVAKKIIYIKLRRKWKGVSA